MASERGNAPEISEIQRQMAQIRQEMHLDVQGAVRSAQSLVDWRTLVASHPWLSLGIAATAGFLLVPGRRREPQRIVTVAAPPQPEIQAAAWLPAAPARRARWNAFQTAYSLVAPVAVRAAQNYALTHLEQWLSAHALVMPASPRAREADQSEPAAGRRTPGARTFGT